MIKKISKRYLILSISGFLLLVTGTIFACAGGDDFADFYNSFFAPETSNDEVSKPFYRSVHTFYGDYYFSNFSSDLDSANIEDWHIFFQKKVTREDLSYIIYKSRIGELDTCIFYLRNSAYPIEDYLKNNSLLTFDDKALAKEFLFYQGFAKRCELYANYVRNWWDDDSSSDPRNDIDAMQKLLIGGQKALSVAKSPLIKQRYAFQIVRLFYQAKLYDESISFYDSNKEHFTPKNTIYYRTLGYVAACNYKLEEYSKANYLYSLIFDGCDLMKKTSFLSFHPQEESDWVASLALAQTTREKEVLWHLLGIYVDPLRAMKEIYTLNPKSNLLDLLLVRAVNINEELFIGHQSYWDEDKGASYAFQTQKVDSDLLKFIQTVSVNNNTSKPYLWNLASGYLNLIVGNYKQAESDFSKSESIITNDSLVFEQIRAFRIVSKIEQYMQVNAKNELELASELKWLSKTPHQPALRSSYINQWALSRLSEKYYSWGDSVKAQCLDNTRNPYFYNNEKNVDDLIALIDKPSKSEFEKYILEVYPYKKRTLVNYKAISRIYQHKLDEAIALLDACPDAGSGYLSADPFVIHINDCHDCDFEVESTELYTKYSFVKKLIELEEMSKSDSKNAAEYYFLIANGLYNMTYFGNVHEVFSSPIINLEIGHIYWNYDSQEINSNRLFFDCDKAMEYYQKAMNASNDKEFKAMCCFMAAKCEQNQYFISTQFSYDNAIKSGTFYNQLYNNYSDTQYYNEVLNECGYFKTFVAQK